MMSHRTTEGPFSLVLERSITLYLGPQLQSLVLEPHPFFSVRKGVATLFLGCDWIGILPIQYNKQVINI